MKITRWIVCCFFFATADTFRVLADVADSPRKSLAEAVAAFNKQAAEDPIGKEQPPLTEEAVVAAIRWEMLHRTKLLVSDETFRTLGEIVQSGSLPKGFDLEKQRGYEPNDQVTFDVWSVRLRIPGGTLPGGTTCITIQEKMIRSRPIGEEERKVIHKWQEFERARGGIGSFERVDWMRRYGREREEAAARDRER
jgi:hypothetical protein